MCKELGGSVEIDTEAGAGTTLTFHLQLSRASTARLSITPAGLRPSGTTRIAG
jgi:chemotaxis protein histidine kinase CheA